MKLLLRILIGAAALAVMFPVAHAADMPVKAPAALAAASDGGLYFGLLGAGAKTPTDVAFLNIPGTGNIKPSGYMAGALVGAGMWRNGFFLGLEADGSFDFSKAKQPCAEVADCTVKSGFFLTQRVVIGAQLSDITGAARRAAPASVTQWRDQINVPTTLSASTIMPYLTAGIAERRIEACVDIVDSPSSSRCTSEWLIGATGGGGVRIPVSANFSVGAEYLYVRYDKHFAPAGGPPLFEAEFKTISEHVGRLSLIGHF